jgi:hypothetical protein
MLHAPVRRAELLILQFPEFERNIQAFDVGLASQCVKEESDMGIQIRTATDADLPSILALYVQVEDDGRVLSVEEARPIFARMRSYPDYKVYVATLDGSIVGTFALLIMENLAHKGAPSGVLEDVVVQGDWQHRASANK